MPEGRRGELAANELLNRPQRSVVNPPGTETAKALQREFSGKRALVTGGLGFIGSNLAHAVLPLGCEVTLLDSKDPIQGANDFNLHGIEADVDLRCGDIRDPEV